MTNPKRRKPEKPMEVVQLERWRKSNRSENQELQILELDWPVAIEIIQCAIKIVLEHGQDAEQPETAITEMMLKVLSRYARASAQAHSDDGFRLHQTVQALQTYLSERLGTEVPIDRLVTNPRVMAILERISAAVS